MHDRLDELTSSVVSTMEKSIKQACPTCKRGAAEIAPPTLDDLEALVTIRDGFNKHRRNFSPTMEETFRRFDSTIAYLHAMIAGTEDDLPLR